MNLYNYNHLFYFYITAKLNGVTIAAKHLNTSQSSLSTQIKTLEAVLKRPLFKKSGRKIELTDFGREVYGYCRRAFEVFDEMFDRVESSPHAMGARISIGVSAEIERPFISEALSKISRQYPKNQRPLLNLISLQSNQLLQLLKLGELDLLLTTGIGSDNEVQVACEFELPVGAFAHPNLTENIKGDSVEKIISKSGVPAVLPSKGTVLRSEIDGFLSRKKIQAKCHFESNILSAVVRAACDGLGITILPEPYLARELRQDRILRVSGRSLWNHKLSVLARRGRIEDGRMTFLAKLATHFKENLNIQTKIRIEQGASK